MGRFTLMLAGSLLSFGVSAFAYGGAEMTREQSLKVADVLMRANRIQNTYGGRANAVSLDGHTTTISIQRVEQENKFLIYLSHLAPAIELDEIAVDGVPLLNVLQASP